MSAGAFAGVPRRRGLGVVLEGQLDRLGDGGAVAEAEQVNPRSIPAEAPAEVHAFPAGRPARRCR